MDTVATAYTAALGLLIGVAALLLLMASFHDLALRLLPNWTTLGIAGAGLGLRALDGTLPMALAACAAVFAGCFLCWRMRWMGGGDVKLLAAAALLVPPSRVVDLIMLTAIAGGVLATVYVLLGRILAHRRGSTGLPSNPAPRRGRPALARRLWRIERQRMVRRQPLPYGCAIAGAALILMLGPFTPMGL